MTIDLKKLTFLPATMMFVFATHIAISFNDVEMNLASYLSLGLTLLSFAFCLVLITRTGNVTRLLMFTLLFMLLILTLSLVNALDWKDWFYITLTVMLLMMLFQYYRDNPKALLLGALAGFSVSIYAQLGQCVLHPEMWLIEDDKTNAGYLLGGNYNAIGCRIIAALLTAILALRLSKWWWLNLVPLAAASLAILFMVQSMTSVTCVILLLILFLLPNLRLQRLACYGLFAIVILFEVFVCLQGKGFENNDIARWFIVEVLGKDITFTNRTGMWDSALRTVTETPLWGWGYPDEHWFFSYMSSFAYGTHNFILGMLVYGGILGLTLYCCIFYTGFRPLLAHRDYHSNAILIAMAVLHVMMLMENYPVEFPLYIITLAYFYDDIVRATDKTHMTK